MTIPTTKGEFSQRLDRAVKNLDDLRNRPWAVSESTRLTQKKEAVENGLAMWIALTATAHGQEFHDAVTEYSERIHTLADMEEEGAHEGYQLIMGYIRESAFFEE